jgi:hypothetical protein
MLRFPQKPLHLDLRELRKNLGSGKTIFVCSGTDLFAEDVPSEWILKVFDHLEKFPDNTYLLQTKNPARLLDYIDRISGNMICCMTMESDKTYSEISDAPSIYFRYAAMRQLKEQFACRVMVTVEPILDFNLDSFSAQLIAIHPEQINIGADSKRHKLPEPEGEKIRGLILKLRSQNITVHIKPNLNRLLVMK